ncbi:MAG TPA: hypothetical protein VGX28_09700 [Frankiaceae bacterium]|nr:hypothetical protein [Frankiaceae bacterium]
MKRVLILAAAAVALASSFGVAPANAAGNCDEKIEIGCNETPCAPDWPCTITICVVYVSPKCLV